MDIVVDSRLRLDGDLLPPDALKALKAAFVHDNPQFHKLQRINPRAAYAEPRKITTWADGEDGAITLPRGGAPRVREVLREHGLSWHFVDCRCSGREDWRELMPTHLVEPYPFQREMVDAALAVENCIWKSPPGSGKTTGAIRFICEAGLPALIIVWTGALLEQWQKRLLAETSLEDPDEIGVVGGGKYRLRPVTVAMQQTLNKMKPDKRREIHETFGTVVCDEVQKFAASTFLKTVDCVPARYRLGVSADEKRKDGKQFLIYDEFGIIAADVEYDTLVEQGFIHDVSVRIVPTTFRAPWYAEQRDRFGQWQKLPKEEKRRRSREAPLPPDFNALLDEMQSDEERNELAMGVALEQVAKGHMVLVFSHRREHCARFDSGATAHGLKAGRLLGTKADRAEFDRVVDGINAGEIDIAAGTYQSIGLGLDLPRADRAIIATPAAQSKQFWVQVRGRLCRRADGKTDAVAYYLWDEDAGTTPLHNLRKWNDDVTVWHRGEWMLVRQYLKERS